MSSRTSRRASIVAALTGAIACSACNLLAGIDEGILTDAGSDVAFSGDGGIHRETSTDRDASAGKDASKDAPKRGDASDATTHEDGGDAGKDAGSPRDSGQSEAGHDAAFPTVKCTAEGNTVLIDDLSRADSGSTQYSEQLFVALGSDGIYVFARFANDDTDFVLYTVNLNGSGGVSRTTYSGMATSGLSLLDVRTRGTGTNEVIEVLTTYFVGPSGGGDMNGLQLVTSPNANPSDLTLGRGFAPIAADYAAAKLADLPPNDAGNTVGFEAIYETRLSAYELIVGVGPGVDGGLPPADLYSQQTTQFALTNNEPFFANGNSLYALMNQFNIDGGIDGGVLEYVVTDDLREAGVVGSLAPPMASQGTLIAGKTSATNASQVIVMAATLGDAGVVPSAATISPALLPNLVIGGEHFTSGRTLAAGAVPFYGGSSSAWSGDDFVSVGAGTSGSGILLLWLAPDGRVVTSSTDTVLTTRNPVVSTAVQFDGFLSENTGSQFDVVWIEQGVNDADMPTPQRLSAARVTCLPVVDGG